MNKRILAAIIITVGVIVGFTMAFFLGCPIKQITGIECPACGMTRAVISLCRLDFAAAFNYHPLVFLLPVIILFIVKGGKIFKNRFINYTVMFAIIGAFVINYGIRLSFANLF